MFTFEIVKFPFCQEISLIEFSVAPSIVLVPQLLFTASKMKLFVALRYVTASFEKVNLTLTDVSGKSSSATEFLA